MMSLRFLISCWIVVLPLVFTGAFAPAQEYGQPDRDAAGDEAIQQWLAEEARRLDAQFADDVQSREHFEKHRPQWRASGVGS